MSEVDREMVDCWRVNFGLDKNTPQQAMRWWSEQLKGMAPAGAVAALGLVLNERDALIADALRYRYLRNRNPEDVLPARGLSAGLWIDCENTDGILTLVTGDDADAAIDAAMKAQADGN